MAKLIIVKDGLKKRGIAVAHKNNPNVIMNSASMWYGPAKSGKTRILTKSFKGTEYVFLDFDRNYDDVAEAIEDNGGIYLNGKSAVSVLYQLLDGDITDTVVIIDALSDVKKYMLKYQMTKMNKEGERYGNCEACLAGIGINQEDTTTWFRETVDVMTNNSNSINFIHHTTENGRSKVEGNAGAWSAKFDITYMMVLDQKSNYFELTHERSNIAPKTVGNTKTLDDAIRFIEARVVKKYNEDFDEITGDEFNSLELKPSKLPSWILEFRNDAIDCIFTRTKKGRKTTYKRKVVDVKEASKLDLNTGDEDEN